MSDVATLDEPITEVLDTAQTAHEEDTVVDTPPPEPDPAAERAEKARLRREYLKNYDRETDAEVCEITDRLRDAKNAWEDSKAQTSARKKAVDVIYSELFEYKAEREKNRGLAPQPKLYPDPPRGDEDNDEPAADLDDVPDLAGGATPEDDAWKALPIMELVEHCGLKKPIADKLGEQGLDTLGKLSAYSEPNANGYIARYTDLNGIGQAKADQITEAFAAFWPVWNARKTDASQPRTGGVAGESGDGDHGQGGGVDIKTWTEEAQRVADQKLPD